MANLKDLYYIGEAAEILNISTQTLRYYDKIGILQPAYTDPVTGYRKYTYDQISYAERIRHLQTLGLNLEEIQSAIQGNSISILSDILKRKREETQSEIRRLSSLQNDIDWYLEYYEHERGTEGAFGLPFTADFDERYVLAEPTQTNDGPYGIGHRLLRRKNSRSYNRLTYLRQNGYILDYDKFIAGELMASHYFVLLRDNPPFESPYTIRIPAGTYFCFRTKLLSDPLPGEMVERYLGHPKVPPLVIACEYEDNFSDFQHCPYEIQILIQPDMES